MVLETLVCTTAIAVTGLLVIVGSVVAWQRCCRYRRVLRVLDVLEETITAIEKRIHRIEEGK